MATLSATNRSIAASWSNPRNWFGRSPSRALREAALRQEWITAKTYYAYRTIAKSRRKFPGAWRRDPGPRIDHLLLSPQAADRLVAVGLDRDPRDKAKASDHTPVWCELSG